MTAQAGYVYLAYGESTRYIKVGKTTTLPKRLRTLQHGVPFILTLLWAERVADIDHAEGILKQRYAPYKTRSEWFAIPPAVLAQWGLTIPQTTAYEETYKVELRVFCPPPQICAAEHIRGAGQKTRTGDAPAPSRYRKRGGERA